MNANFMLQNATKLTKSQMKNVKGGMSYCDKLQEWANTYYETATDEQWDQWADYWLDHCTK